MDINTALYYDRLATAANYFSRVKQASFVREYMGNDFNSLSDLAAAANAVGLTKSAEFNLSGATPAEALNSVVYDAAKGILRMRNISQL